MLVPGTCEGYTHGITKGRSSLARALPVNNRNCRTFKWSLALGLCKASIGLLEKLRPRTGKTISWGHLIDVKRTFLEDSGPDNVVVWAPKS